MSTMTEHEARRRPVGLCLCWTRGFSRRSSDMHKRRERAVRLSTDGANREARSEAHDRPEWPRYKQAIEPGWLYITAIAAVKPGSSMTAQY